MKPWNKFHVREFDHSELKALLENYFSSVYVMGLFAEESTYLVEKNRLARAREAARKKQRSGLYGTSRAVAEKVVPARIVTVLKRLVTGAPQSGMEADHRFTGQHSLGDFFYRDDELDLALDLFAICADDDVTLTGITQRIRGPDN
jgi:hypothetical protein